MQGFAGVASVLTIPYMGHVKGYKFAFIIICFPIIVSCILQYFATNAVQLLIATILQGVTMGGNVSLGVIIVAEFADPKYRGIFLVLKSATFFWGVWIANAIGTFYSWRNIPLVSLWPAVFALITCFTWPQSPYWLASKGRIDECKKSFRWLRGQGFDAEKELGFLLAKKTPPKKIQKMLSFVKSTIVLRQFYMPMFLNIAMFFLYHSCGKLVCQTYVLVIIKKITKNDSAAYTGMLIIDGITIFGMYIGSYVAKKVRRRLMYFSTTASTIFFLYLFSFYLYLVQFGVIEQNNTVSLILLILYSFSVSWGPMVLSTSIFTEITPMRYKPFISSITVTIFFILQSSFLKFGPWLFTNIKFSGTFAFYGTLTLFPLVFLVKYLPETGNRTLEEIEMFYVKSKPYNDSLHQHEGEEMLSVREKRNG